MVSKIPVKTVNRVYSKAAVIPFPTPQQNIYVIHSGETEMGSKQKNKIWITIMQLYL